MARATVATVKRMVYDNLGITDQSGGYGNLATNERYLSGYIDDAIMQADIACCELLLVNKQDLLMSESIQTTAGTDNIVIDNKWFLVNVEYYSDSGAGNPRLGSEIGIKEFYQILDNAGGVFDATTSKGLYAIDKGTVYVIPDQTYLGSNFQINYINLSHPSSLAALQAPSGFEGAVANLATAILMLKRMDNPAGSQAYMGLYKEFMAIHLPPNASIPEPVND